MIAKCLKVTYKPGAYELCQGVKGYQHGKMVNGKWFRNRGYGWGESIQFAKLILRHEAEGLEHESWMERFFRDHLGRLTEDNRELIIMTMPDTVEVDRQVSARGTVYYTVRLGDLQSWLARIRALPAESVQAVRDKLKRRKTRARKKSA